ncbi:DUF3302 domain-containing protein [Roseateles oligotrophus]|uniref:DUF3302 domain-containing protein n=1 Tax=Roseateles oligotrophus TaxID=1769250 RepID=A0ABT2YLU5_9BURK|nr:DUF3302 domain-containing protein [Roseateles oligotrophus]MCV2371040.1 DUF3302 domain-containing protein [Roseateles oligotrophus]
MRNTRIKLSAAHAATIAALGMLALPAQASGHSGPMVDTIANAMSWFVICVIPIAALAAFWMVHVMPEKIAHKNHHPQTKAIQVLCLLSLVFGGLLWPLAWLWAYTKPTNYRQAYGTDKHGDYHLEMAAKFRAGQLSDDERTHLRDELDAMFAKGALAPELTGLRTQLHEANTGAAA